MWLSSIKRSINHAWATRSHFFKTRSVHRKRACRRIDIAKKIWKCGGNCLACQFFIGAWIELERKWQKKLVELHPEREMCVSFIGMMDFSCLRLTWYCVQLKQCQQQLSPSTYFFAWPRWQGRLHTDSGDLGCESLNWISGSRHFNFSDGDVL